MCTACEFAAMTALAVRRLTQSSFFFFFNDTATTEIYTLSLHDALPIWPRSHCRTAWPLRSRSRARDPRSEEHTSELQSRQYLVCRLLLEKKKLAPHAQNTDIDTPKSPLHTTTYYSH